MIDGGVRLAVVAAFGLLLLAGCAHKGDLRAPDPGWVVEVARVGPSEEPGKVRVRASIRNTSAATRLFVRPVHGRVSGKSRDPETGELEASGDGQSWGFSAGCDPRTSIPDPIPPGGRFEADYLAWDLSSTNQVVEATLHFEELREGQCLRHSLVGVLRLDPGASKGGESSP